MKNLITLFAFLPLFLSAQISMQPASIDFNATDFGNLDSIEVTIENQYSNSIDVEGIMFHEIYSNAVFYTTETFPLSVAANSSESVWVYFEPEHNIVYNSEMIVVTDYRGSYRADVEGEGRFSNYYSNTFNKSEEDLKSALKSTISSGYSSLSYNVARDNMYGSLDNTGGNVACVYTGRVAAFNTRPGANSNSFNCEHTYPQGLFNSNSPMKSDIHHLFPTDVNANSQRGNLPFGEVSGSGSWSEGGSKKGNGKFEPRDAQKGATARAMMYFVTRYQDYSSFFSGQQTILKQCHNNHAPTAKEKQRNAAIFGLQNNRNPFVDYPQFIERIQNLVGNSQATENYDLWVSDLSVEFGSSLNDLEYHVVLFNRGNQPVEVGNFNFSNAAYSLVNAVGTQTISPGESLELLVATDASLPIGSEEELTFDTDIPGNATVTIQLIGGWFPASTEELEENAFNVYPNPTQNEINFAIQGNQKAVILTLDGKRMKDCHSPCNVSELNNGSYLLQLPTGESKVFIKE